jgi:hypothetical protein
MYVLVMSTDTWNMLVWVGLFCFLPFFLSLVVALSFTFVKLALCFVAPFREANRTTLAPERQRGSSVGMGSTIHTDRH